MYEAISGFDEILGAYSLTLTLSLSLSHVQLQIAFVLVEGKYLPTGIYSRHLYVSDIP